MNAINGSLNKVLIDVAMNMVKAMQDLLLHPPNLDKIAFVAVLYGNAKGVVPTLVYLSTFFALFISILSQKKTGRLIIALPLAFAVLIGNALWFENAHYMTDWGTELTKSMNFFTAA